MRRLTTAPLVAQLVVTIGLMLALIGLAAFDLGPGRAARRSAPSSGRDGLQHRPDVHAVLPADHDRRRASRSRSGCASCCTARASVSRCARWSTTATSPALNGARPGRRRSFSWALGASMAAIAGIFLAEELSTLSDRDADAAHRRRVRGRDHRPAEEPADDLRRRPDHRALALVPAELPHLVRAVGARRRPAIPTIILFLALLFLPQDRIEGRRIVRGDRRRAPISCEARAVRVRRALRRRARALGLRSTGPTCRRLTIALVTALIMLSLVPLTGWSGQISLAQITFVGIGAWADVRVLRPPAVSCSGSSSSRPGNPLLLLVGALVAIPFGVLMALAGAAARRASTSRSRRCRSRAWPSS